MYKRQWLSTTKAVSLELLRGDICFLYSSNGLDSDLQAYYSGIKGKGDPYVRSYTAMHLCLHRPEEEERKEEEEQLLLYTLTFFHPELAKERL